MFGDKEKKRIKQEKITREITARQQQIQRVYQKRLSGKNMNALVQFANSGKHPGSSEFFKLHPMVQEVVIKLNTASLEVMSKNTMNPFKKTLFWLQKLMFKNILKKENKKHIEKVVSGKGKKKKKAKK